MGTDRCGSPGWHHRPPSDPRESSIARDGALGRCSVSIAGRGFPAGQRVPPCARRGQAAGICRTMRVAGDQRSPATRHCLRSRTPPDASARAGSSGSSSRPRSRRRWGRRSDSCQRPMDRRPETPPRRDSPGATRSCTLPGLHHSPAAAPARPWRGARTAPVSPANLDQ